MQIEMMRHKLGSPALRHHLAAAEEVLDTER